MFRFAVVLAVLAVASAAPGFLGSGFYGHGAAVVPGHVGFAAAPALVKTAVPVAPVAPVASVAYAAPAVVKSAVVSPAVAVAAPAVVKTPVLGAYGYGHGYGAGYGAGLYGGHFGGFGGHFGGFGGHFVH